LGRDVHDYLLLLGRSIDIRCDWMGVSYIHDRHPRSDTIRINGTSLIIGGNS
jgi:hypothetical protein